MATATATPLKFLDKELSGIPLTSELLLKLLAQETDRKVILETREKELESQTISSITARGTLVKSQITSSIRSIQTLKSNLLKIYKDKLPSRFTNPNFYNQLDKIQELERIIDYLIVSHFVRYLSGKIGSSLHQGNELLAVSYLDRLRSIKSHHFTSTECTNLFKYVTETVEIWESQLELKFVNDFTKLIEQVGWPHRIDTANPSNDTLHKFTKVAKCLKRINIQIPTKQKPILLIDFKDTGGIVMDILLKPLRKRFRYNFFTNKPTSDPNRPDWYYAQVRQWIRELCPWLEQHLKPINNLVVAQFIQGLEELLVLKTGSLLDDETVPDTIFSKLLEESIRFETEILELYPESSPEIPSFVNTVFSQSHVLSRWISIERLAALSKLDELFPSSSAWDRAIVPGPTEIGSLFIIMLQFLVDRFSFLRQPGQKLQFLQLLVEVLDDFKVRCYQVWKSKVGERDFAIADTLNYVESVIQDWEELQFFSSLVEFRDNLENAAQRAKETSPLENIGTSAEGLFSKIVHSYRNLTDSIFSEWESIILEEVKQKFFQHGYFRKKWFSTHSVEFDEVNSVSPELIPLITYLPAAIKKLLTGMDSKLAKLWIERLCEEIDLLVLDELFLKNKFTPKAMIQVQFDILEGLLPIFPSGNLAKCMAVLRIWELPTGDAILMYETLIDGDVQEVYKFEAIEEAELGALRMGTLIKILKGRLETY